jgi:hypothetical protein
MDEDHRRTRIQGGEQLVLTFLAQVSARIVGEQHHAIGTQFVKRSDDLGGGAVDMWHRTVAKNPNRPGCALTRSAR